MTDLAWLGAEPDHPIPVFVGSMEECSIRSVSSASFPVPWTLPYVLQSVADGLYAQKSTL